MERIINPLKMDRAFQFAKHALHAHVLHFQTSTDDHDLSHALSNVEPITIILLGLYHQNSK